MGRRLERNLGTGLRSAPKLGRATIGRVQMTAGTPYREPSIVHTPILPHFRRSRCVFLLGIELNLAIFAQFDTSNFGLNGVGAHSAVNFALFYGISTLFTGFFTTFC